MRIKILLVGMDKTDKYIFNCNSSEYTHNGSETKAFDSQIFLENFKTIIKGWPTFLINTEVQDGMLCKIKIKKDDAKKEFNFSGQYPENFDQLLILLNEVTYGK